MYFFFPIEHLQRYVGVFLKFMFEFMPFCIVPVMLRTQIKLLEIVYFDPPAISFFFFFSLQICIKIFFPAVHKIW